MAIESGGRRRWMSVLAQASGAELERAWLALGERPAYRIVRKPEVGLVMVRGRAGGSGAAFNLGEMTVTRCTVDLASGIAGHAYVAGRDARHAELAAVFDALLQDPLHAAQLEEGVIAPLEAGQQERRRRVAGRSAPTRVEFFTLVRGGD